jgi:hypothetical protein
MTQCYSINNTVWGWSTWVAASREDKHWGHLWPTTLFPALEGPVPGLPKQWVSMQPLDMTTPKLQDIAWAGVRHWSAISKKEPSWEADRL